MVVDESYVELKTDAGKTYFWNRRENSRSWALPEGVSVKWVGQKSPDGRTYYWCRETKETVWVLPALPKQQESKETLAAKEARGTAAAVAQAPTAAVRSPAPAKQEARAATAPAPAPVKVFRGAAEPLLCRFPEAEAAGPRGESSSAVAARHMIEKSCCDSWFRRCGPGEWEEVLRFWPPPEDAPLGSLPTARKPKPDPHGLRELAHRAQQYEDIARAMFVCHHGVARKFSVKQFPYPKANEWCFWTPEGEQLVVDAEAPIPSLKELAEGAEPVGPVVKRIPPEGDKWKMLSGKTRSALLMVYNARRLRSLEFMIRKGDKAAIQALLDELSTKVPERLLDMAKAAMASEPKPKQPPPAGAVSSTAPAPAMVDALTPSQPMMTGFTLSPQPAMGMAMVPGMATGPMMIPPPPGMMPPALAMPLPPPPPGPPPPGGVAPGLLPPPPSAGPMLVLPPADGMTAPLAIEGAVGKAAGYGKAGALLSAGEAVVSKAAALGSAALAAAQAAALPKGGGIEGVAGSVVLIKAPPPTSVVAPPAWKAPPAATPEVAGVASVTGAAPAVASPELKAPPPTKAPPPVAATAPAVVDTRSFDEVAADAIFDTLAPLASGREPSPEPERSPEPEQPGAAVSKAAEQVAAPVVDAAPPKEWTMASAAPVEADPNAPWKKRRRRAAADMPAADKAAPAAAPAAPAAVAPKAGASDSRAAAQLVASAARFASAAAGGAAAAVQAAEDKLRRKVVISGAPVPATNVELADFFTGAIFSATGHTLAAQWQSGEASKVVVGVERPAQGGVEVLFGTPLSASVAVMLNGIQFQGQTLSISRPAGYSGPKQKPKLQGISIKELVASDGTAAASGDVGGRTGSAKVRLRGILASMGSKSVFDLLQQFGGPLKDLSLNMNKETGEHTGSGVAEYLERSSALEAVRFSPLLGFIEVSLEDSAEEAARKRQRRSRFDNAPAADAEDLGPFEAALQGRAPKPAGDMDLGPFESILPKASAAEDLGPFESVLPPAGAPAEDLGPFEAVLTKASSQPSAADPLDDLGPFGAVLKEREAQPDDLGPFAAAIQGFESR